jgi:hypothetical protein
MGFFFFVVARFAMAGSVSDVAASRGVVSGSQQESYAKSVLVMGRRGA